MNQYKFVEGKEYYRCFLHDDGARTYPVADTWVYRGAVRLDFTQEDCEVPYQFHLFCRLVTGEAVERAQCVNIPSLRQAGQSMLTWEEFINENRRLTREWSRMSKGDGS
jgi:hypothetical protein